MCTFAFIECLDQVRCGVSVHIHVVLGSKGTIQFIFSLSVNKFTWRIFFGNVSTETLSQHITIVNTIEANTDFGQWCMMHTIILKIWDEILCPSCKICHCFPWSQDLASGKSKTAEVTISALPLQLPETRPAWQMYYYLLICKLAQTL